MHRWGDEWFEENGEDFGYAINYCMQVWRTWGRISTHGKEKYGTFRDCAHFWEGSIYTFIYPGHVWIRHRWLYFYIDRYLTRPLTKYTGVRWLVRKYQTMIYNYAVQKMCKKFPNIVDELVCDLDQYREIKPGMFGDVDGTKIHNKYWTSI